MLKILETVKQLICKHNYKIMELQEDYSSAEDTVRKFATFQCTKCDKIRKGIVSFEKV